jgi:YVTN family beta-propeller protein
LPAASDLTAYVAETDGYVVPVDVTTATAETPIKVDQDPSGIAVTPNGQAAFVADAGAGTVTPIDLATGTAEAPIQVASNGGIGAVAITPNGAIAVAAVDPTDNANGSVVFIKVATGAMGSPIPVGDDPVAIAITPDGSTAYVANHGDGTITPVSLDTNTAGAPIPVGVDPIAIAITPDGGVAYVLWGNGHGFITPVTLAANPADDLVGTAFGSIGGAPQGIAIVPGGSFAYALGGTAAGRMSLPSGAMDPALDEVADFMGAAISPDGTTALLGYTYGDWVDLIGAVPIPSEGVMVVDVSSDAMTAVIAQTSAPVSIAIRPS